MSVPTPETRLKYVQETDDRWKILYDGAQEDAVMMGLFTRNEDGKWSLWLVDAGLGWTKPYRKELDQALDYLRTGGELG